MKLAHTIPLLLLSSALACGPTASTTTGGGSADASSNPCAPHGQLHDGHCDCDRGYVAQALSCVLRPDAGALLDGGEDADGCGPHGEDHGGHCDCEAGYVEQGGICVASSADGGADPDGCGPHGVLHNGHCDCEQGYTEHEGVCEPLAACAAPDDQFEDNDSDETPAAAPLGTDGGAATLRLCPGDEDWFSVSLTAGQTVTIDVLFSHAEGDLDVYLWAPGAEPHTDMPAGASDGTADNERVTFQAAAAGDHLFVVTGHNGAQAAYQLRVVVTP